MTQRSIIPAIAIAISLLAAGTASAQFSNVNFPTLTFADEFDGNRGKAKACTAHCKN